MSIELRWVVSDAVGSLHAADALAYGLPLLDPNLAAALRQPVSDLVAELEAANVPPERFWQHVVPQAAGGLSHRQLAKVALTKSLGRHDETVGWRVGDRLREIDAAYRSARPNSVESIRSQADGLREVWVAQGAGILHVIGELTQAALLVSSADVLLVEPVLGYGGAAHLLYNSVRFEVPPSDVAAQPADVIRLAWLLSQLNMDVPALNETINAARLPGVAALATLPAALAAAEQEQLARCDQSSLERAIADWHVTRHDAVRQADIVWRWWNGYRDARPQWSVAIGALDQMLRD